jgi:TP901 family phage tail tape measure protein
MNQKKIIYDIGFKVDESGTQKATGALAKITSTLKQIKGTTIDSFMASSGITDITKANEQLKLVQASAVAVGNALQSSFNQSLNTFNISNFNKELKSAGFSVKDLNTLWSQTGSQGQLAFMQVTNAITQTQSVARQSTGVFNQLGKTMMSTMRWRLTSGFLQGISSSIREAWGYTKALDTSLNNIRIVTEKSALDMEKFAKSANNAARNLATATTEYTNASLIYYQQGLSDEEVEARTKVTIKAANVTGQSAQEVSEQLTAVWNGYRVAAEEAELYIDKLAAVAANTASNLEELSEGMSKVASSANAMGIDIDQLTAQISTIVSVTRQDASLVGTALKTIYARMGDLQVDGVDEFGTSLGDVSGKMRQMGIDVLDQEGNLRDMGSVIEEVAAKWGTWTEAQQQAAAVAIAGKRQYNNLIALFENWDMYESALDISQNAEGTLEKQQQTYKESIAAMTKEVEAAKESFKGELFDAESIEKITDLLEGLFRVLGFITSALGGVKNMLPLILGLVMKMAPVVSGTMVRGIYDFGIGLKNLVSGASTMNVLGNNVADTTGKMSVLNEQFREAINNRMRLEKMKQGGLISEEQYMNARTSNEAVIKNLEDQARMQVEREQLDNQATTEGTTKLSDVEAGRAGSESFAQDRMTNLDGLSREQLKQSNANYANYVKEIGVENGKLKKGIQGVEDAFKDSTTDLNQAVQKTRTEIEKLSKLKYLTPEQKAQLDQLEQELKQASTTNSGQAEALKKTNAAMKNFGGEYLNQTKEMAHEAEKVARGQDDMTKNSRALAKNQENTNKQMGEFKGLEIGQNISNMASSLMMAAGAAGVLTNVMEGLKNGTMGVGEAITGIASGVAMAAPAFMSSFKMIKTAGTGAGSAIQKAFGWISLVMNIIAMAVSLISSIVKMVGDTKSAEDKARERYEAMNKTLEDMNKNYQETRKSLIELKDEIADYRDARKGIDELRAGTEEWKDAIEDLNLKVLELVEKYPQLQLIQKQMYGQTLYEIDSASIDAALKAKKDSIASQEWALAVQKTRTARANKDLQIAEMSSGSKEETATLHYFTNMSNSYDYQGDENAQQYFDGILSDMKEFLGGDYAEAIYEDGLYSPVTHDNNYLDEYTSDLINKSGGVDYYSTKTEKGAAAAATYEYSDTLSIDTLKLAEEKTLGELLQLEEQLEDMTGISDEQKEFLKNSLQEAQKANQKLDRINKTISKEEENLLRAFAKTQGIDENVFANIAKRNEDAVPEVDTANKDRRDFIKNEGFNRFVHVELNDDGSIKMDGNTIKTDQKQRVGGKVQKGDVSQAKSWIDNLVKAAYGPDAKVESYGKLQGVATANLGAVEITVDGEKKTIDQVKNDVYVAAQRQVMEKQNEALIKYQKQLQSEGRIEEAAYFATKIGDVEVFDLDNFQWDEGTLAKYNTVVGYGGDVGINAAKAKAKFESEISGYLGGVKDLTFKDEKGNILSKFNSLTGSQIKTLSLALQEADSFGANGALTKLINDEIKSPYQLEKVVGLLENANWNSSEWITSFEMGLHDIGVNIEDPKWKQFFDDINSGMKQWMENSKKVRENMAFIQETMAEMQAGDTISDEEYQQLLEIDPSFARDFIQGPGGWIALRSGEALAKKGRAAYSNLDSAYTAAAQRSDRVSQLTEAGFLAGGAAEISTASEITSYLKPTQDKYNKSRIAAIAEANGINPSDITQLLVDMKSSDNTVADNAKQKLLNYIQYADQMMIDEATGQNDPEQIFKNWAMSGVSWEEVINSDDWLGKDGKNFLTDTARADIATAFKNKIRAELGVSGTWGDKLEIKISDDEVATGVEALEIIANKTYQRDLDHYQQVEAALDKIDAELENSTGADKWSLWQNKITSSQDAISIAQSKAGYSQDVYDASASAIKNNEAYASFAASLFNEKDGSFNLAAAYAALTEYRGTEAEKDIQKLIDDYIANEEAKTEQIEKQNEAIEVQLDLLKEQQEAIKTFVEFLNDDKEFWDVQMGNKTTQGFLGEASIESQMGLISQKTAGLMVNFEGALGQLAALKDKEGGLNSAAFVEAYEQAKEYLSNYKDLIKDTEELWLSTVDKTLELYDKQIERFKTLNSVLQSTADLTKLIGTNTNKLIDTYYESFVNNAKSTYNGALEKMQQAQKIYNNAMRANGGVTDEMRAKATEALETTTQDFLAAATEWAEAIKTAFTERVSTAINNALKDATGYGLTDMSQAWELETAQDERYLDEVNKAYAIGEFERKIQKSIDETDNVAIQQRLNDLRARELELLERKDKLTQYDLDRANAEYELELKRIALEESQQASNKMKLARDAMGNYTYQYVADQDAIAQAEEELAAAQNELYNLDKDRKKELIDEWFSMMTEYESKMSEAMDTGNTKLQEDIQKYYFGSDGILKAIQDELNLMGTNADWLNNVFNGTSSRIVDVRITGKDGTDLTTILNGIFGDAKGNFTTLTNTISAEGGLTNSINSLTASAGKASTVLYSLSNNSGTGAADKLVSNLGGLASNIYSYTQKLITALGDLDDYSGSATKKASEDALATNTDAIKALTASAYTLVDKLDGSFDGNYAKEGFLGADGEKEQYYTISKGE